MSPGEQNTMFMFIFYAYMFMYDMGSVAEKWASAAYTITALNQSTRDTS